MDPKAAAAIRRALPDAKGNFRRNVDALLSFARLVTRMTGSAAARLAPALAPVEEIELNRTVYLYGVAGRQRTAVGSTIFKMLRAADWSRYAS